jgi:hypothetical protein
MVATDDVEKKASYEVEDNLEILSTRNPKGDYSGAVAKTDEVEIKLVRKLDRRIMPTLWAMYFLYDTSFSFLCLSDHSSLTSLNRNYLDRNAIAQARLNNLEDDLGLVGSQYNTCISILFVG